jgi:hypothetical protein
MTFFFLLATIDTEQLSSQVRELLSSNSIGQRVFGMSLSPFKINVSIFNFFI